MTHLPDDVIAGLHDRPTPRQEFLLAAVAGGGELAERQHAGERGRKWTLGLTNGLPGCKAIIVVPDDVCRLSALGLVAVQRKAGDVWAEVTAAGCRWLADALQGANPDGS